MEWIEWLLSSEFRKFLLDHDLFFPLLFLGRLIGITAIELIAACSRGVLSQGDSVRSDGLRRVSVCHLSIGGIHRSVYRHSDPSCRTRSWPCRSWSACCAIS